MVIGARQSCVSGWAILQGRDLDGWKWRLPAASASREWRALSEGEVSVKSKYDTVPLQVGWEMNAVFGCQGLFIHDRQRESVGALCLVPLLPAQLPAGTSLPQVWGRRGGCGSLSINLLSVPSCARTCHGLHVPPTMPQVVAPKTMFSDALCASVFAWAEQSLSQKQAL